MHDVIDSSENSYKTHITQKIISKNKGNQAVKFGQFKEYNIRDFFKKNICRKWGGKTGSRYLFCFFKRIFIR